MGGKKWLWVPLIGVFGLVVLLAIAAGGWLMYLNHAFNTRMPDWEATVRHPDLREEVRVLRDDWGVPHITAENEHDLYFALGYCMAQDRLFQLEIMRRLARGELAAAFGPRLVPVDKVLRHFRLRAKAEEYLASEVAQDPRLREIGEAYIAGINHFVATEPLPAEFTALRLEVRPFTMVDTLAVASILPIAFSYGPRQDPMFSIMQERFPDIDMALLFPGYSHGVPATVMESYEEARMLLEGGAPENGARENEDNGAERDDLAAALDGLEDFLWQWHGLTQRIGDHIGSNSWVIAPDRTASGGAMLVNDPHIPFTNPSIWYEAHLRAGDFHSYGYHLSLIPLALIGHNEDRGWALTMFANDDVDLYIERLNPENPGQVMHRGEWVDLLVENERIEVRFGADIDFEIRSTPHGPLVTGMLEQFFGYEGPPIALWWLWQHVDHTNLLAFHKMNQARTLEDFAAAMPLITSPGLNVSYADREGNIAWWAAGKLPIRPPHVNSKALLDGASGDDEILGYLPFEKNPQLINPERGFIATANNKSTVAPLGPIQDLEGYWQPDDRAARIADLLTDRYGWTVADMKAMLMDDFAPASVGIREAMAGAAAASGVLPDLDALEAQAWELLMTWDGRHGVDAVGASIYQALCDFILQKTVGDELGDLFIFYGGLGDAWNFLKYVVHDPDSPFWNNIHTPERETREDILMAAFRAAVAWLAEELGEDPDSWTWGRLHTVTFTHPLGYLPIDAVASRLNIGPFPTPGSSQTINNMLFPHGQLRYDVLAGPSTRRVIDFADPSVSYTILPTGNSGRPASPHYDDQAEMFVRGDFREARFTEEQIAAHARHEMRMLPADS